MEHKWTELEAKIESLELELAQAKKIIGILEMRNNYLAVSEEEEELIETWDLSTFKFSARIVIRKSREAAKKVQDILEGKDE